MPYQIIGTNTVKHVVTRMVDREPQQVEIELSAGRVIAEHNNLQTVEKHCAKLRRCHKNVQFTTNSLNPLT